MGRKSRLKKERKTKKRKEERNVPFLVHLIRYGVYLALFTPLIVSGRFFFPYVGPKGLFFMALSEIVFFLWLFLIIHYRKYRPKLNAVLISLILFILVLALSSIMGVDFSRSFWSKFERMAGLLFHLHLFAFFLVLSSTFKSFSEWKKIFLVSVAVGILVALIYFLSEFKIGIPKIWTARGGSTLGNSSFMGTYFLFDAFLALILFFKSKEALRIFAGIGFVIISIGLILSTAIAAKLSFLGGLFLLGVFYLIFKRKEKTRLAGVVILLIATIVLVYLIFYPQSFVHKKLVDKLGEPRFIVWKQAWEGWKAKPILGWGPSNFLIVYSKFYNPSKPLAGGAPWFDRAHNIILNYLATTGILGLLTFLGIFAASLFVLVKEYLKKKEFWIPALLTSLLIAYFAQNITVFDMPASYMMLFLVLGFIGSFSAREETQKKFTPKNYWAGISLLLIFCVTFFVFVIQPAREDALIIKAIQTIPPTKSIKQIASKNPNQLNEFLKSNSEKRIELYKKTLEVSPLGKYQIRNFFADHSRQYLQKNNKIIPSEVAKKELDFIIQELEKSAKESPLDLKSLMSLIQTYGIYAWRYDSQKLPLVKEKARIAKEIAPTHQYPYWVLAQIEVIQENYDEAISIAEEAVALEPKIPKSQLILIETLKAAGKEELAKKKAQEAIELIPSIKDQVEQILAK